MSVYVTGDTHIPHDIEKIVSWSESNELTKDDVLIIAGDFGLIWEMSPGRVERRWKRFFNDQPYTTLFVDGNHENHARLQGNMKQIKKFGGTVGRVTQNKVFHLRRGEVYEICGKKIFTFGGAESIDKTLRIPHVTWWKEEIPSKAEVDYAIDNLEKHGNCVDYIIAHTAPVRAVEMLENKGFNFIRKNSDLTCRYLEFFCENNNFDGFYCGHWHLDEDFGKYHFLFDRILKIA